MRKELLVELTKEQEEALTWMKNNLDRFPNVKRIKRIEHVELSGDEGEDKEKLSVNRSEVFIYPDGFIMQWTGVEEDFDNGIGRELVEVKRKENN